MFWLGRRSQGFWRGCVGVLDHGEPVIVTAVQFATLK